MEVFVDPLDPFELDTAKRYGTEVHFYAEQKGLQDMKQDDSQDSKQMNIDGSIAEHRFAKHLNIYPNYDLNGPNHVDVYVDGKSVDVKWTSKPNHNMAVRWNITPDNAADYFVLMRGETLGKMGYAGWIGKDEFFEKAITMQGNKGPYRLLNASDLHQGPIGIKENE